MPDYTRKQLDVDGSYVFPYTHADAVLYTTQNNLDGITSGTETNVKAVLDALDNTYRRLDANITSLYNSLGKRGFLYLNGTTTTASMELPTLGNDFYIPALKYDGNGNITTEWKTPANIVGTYYVGTTAIQATSVAQALTGITSIDAITYFDTTNSRIGIGTSTPEQKLTVNGGLLAITNNNNTITIGSQNEAWCHIYNSNENAKFIFNREVAVQGLVRPYTSNHYTSGTSSARWSNVYSVLGNFSGDITTAGKIMVGTGGANSYLASSTATNIYLQNSSGSVLVCDAKVVRRGTTLTDVDLGSTTYPWRALYATTIYENGTSLANTYAPKVHDHDNTYLKLSGGTMTGTLQWTDNNALPQTTSCDYFLTIDSFNDGGTTKWISKANALTSLTGLTDTAKGSITTPIYWTGSAFNTVLATFGSKDYGEHDADNIKSNGLWYYTSNGPTTTLGASNHDGALYSQAYNNVWVAQIAQDYRNGNLFTRGLNNGTWSTWRKVWNDGNDGLDSGLDADLLDGLHGSYYLKEANLEWGGKNFSGTYGPIDAAMIENLGANRSAFINPAGVFVEYSRDNGETWTDYGATDADKIELFSTEGGFVIGKRSANNVAGASDLLRIRVLTDAADIYTLLWKFAIIVATTGSTGSWCTIKARLQSNLESNTETYKTLANQAPLAGWSGYNIINTEAFTTYGNNKASQYGEIIFTFGCTGYSGNGTSQYGLKILKIMCFGGVGWKTPSTMAKTGHLYSYNYLQNAVFPGNLKVPQSTSSAADLNKGLNIGSLGRLGAVNSTSIGVGLYSANEIWLRPGQTNIATSSSVDTTKGIVLSTTTFTYNGTNVSLEGHTHSEYLASNGTAAKATSLAGGALGSIPYQSAAGTTAFLSAGTDGYILSYNNTNKAPEWVAKPTSNVSTSAVIASSASSTSAIVTTLDNPYYNLIEGTSVANSIRFNAGTGISVSATTDNLITFSNTITNMSLLTNNLFINGTQTAATGSWKGNLPAGITSLYNGFTIFYRLPYAGSGNASLQLYAPDGVTTVGGNVPVYGGNTRLTTHFPATSIIRMTYYENTWRANPWYNTNSNVQLANTEATTYRPLLLGYLSAESPLDIATTTVTNISYKTTNLTYSPIYGKMYMTSTLQNQDHGYYIGRGTSTILGLAIGSDGVTRGLRDEVHDSWLCYCDDNTGTSLKVPGTLIPNLINLAGHCLITYDSTNECINFIFL